MTKEKELESLLVQYRTLEIDRQIDYEKFYLYSIITHSTAIEGSTVTEIENSASLFENPPLKWHNAPDLAVKFKKNGCFIRSDG